MKINGLNNTNKNVAFNFKAREYAVVKTAFQGCNQVFDVFKLEYSDVKFLDVMSSRIRLKKLTEGEGYKDNVLRSWKKIINNAVLMSGFDEPQSSFLLAKDKTPCAIMSYKNLPDCYLDNIASWPVSHNNYIMLAGASMFKLLFHNCEKNSTRRIGLDLLKNSRIDLKKYYERMGFVHNPDSEKFITDMCLSRTKMLQTSKQMDSFIKISEVEDPRRVNLFDILTTKFVTHKPANSNLHSG